MSQLSFNIEAKKFHKVLAVLDKAVDRKITIPCLGCIYLAADDGKFVRARSTDLTLDISIAFEAEIQSPGEVLVPARRLSSLVSALSGNLRFDAQENRLGVRAGSASSKLTTELPASFPTSADEFPAAALGLPGDVFKTLLARTVFAAEAGSRVLLTLDSILFSVKGQKAVAVATNGSRLSEAVATLGTPSPEDISVLIPSRAVDVLLSLDAEEVRVAESERHVYFTFGNTQVSVLKLEAKFPNYSHTLQIEPCITGTVQAEAFAESLKRAQVIADVRTSAAKLTFGNDAIGIEASSPEAGEHEDSVPASLSGKPMVLEFNINYLHDFLSRVQGDVTLGIDSKRLALVFSVGDDWRYVVMPMRG